MLLNKYDWNYTHECVEWDGMLIDMSSPEISCCLCYSEVVSWL